MTLWPDHIKATTMHARKGAVRNRFTYGIDFLVIDPEDHSGPALFSRNGFNLFSVHDKNHGGKRGAGVGVKWARDAFATAGLDLTGCRINLLTQPALLGKVFNPVSFWLALRGDDLVAVIAEVNNTFGERHSYICAKPDFSPITPKDTLTAEKVFHVSPFQQVSGGYKFRFDITKDAIAIHITHENGNQGLVATLSGKREPLSNTSILGAVTRRPFGAARTIGLIYWQALKLKIKGAPFRRRPAPPQQEIT